MHPQVDNATAVHADDTLPPSVEGTEQRCFKHLAVCTHNLRPALRKFQFFAFGRHLVRYYAAHQQAASAREEDEEGEGEAEAEEEEELPPPTQQQQQQVDGSPAATAPQQDKQQQQQQAQLPGGEPLPTVSVLRRLGKGGAASPATGAGTEPLLRILFQKRAGTERQLRNAAELVQRCNSWRYTAPSGARVRARCWEAETPSLATGIAASQQADIIVGVHGANLANGWLMRPGSSVIELTMFGFEESPAHLAFGALNYMVLAVALPRGCRCCHPVANCGSGAGQAGALPLTSACRSRRPCRRRPQDPGTQVQHWKLLLCGEGSWAPSKREAIEERAGKYTRQDWAKHRDLIVRCATWAGRGGFVGRWQLAGCRHTQHGPAAMVRRRLLPRRWEALETALRAVVDTAGNMALYRQRYAAGGAWWLSAANATVPAGPDDAQTCRRARKRGLID